MRLVLDLSTSYAWKRPATGIVRVEGQFARHMQLQADMEVACCRLEPVLGRYVEVGREEAERLVQGIERGAAAPAEVPHTSRGKGSTLRVAEALVRRLPEPLRDDARGTLLSGRDLLWSTARLARSCARLARRRAFGSGGATAWPRGMPVPEPFDFAPGDVYVSMGMDWDYNDYGILTEERRRVGFKTLLFCYDTIPVLFPHLIPHEMQDSLKAHLLSLAGAADRVAAISRATRCDFGVLMERAGGPRPQIDVVILGSDVGRDVPEAEDLPPNPGLVGRPFVLVVGTVEARKNHELLYRAWTRLTERHGDRAPLLVLVGWRGWGTGDLLHRIRTDPAVKELVFHFEHLGDGGLMWLYRNCLFTVFPSLYEGWGLPVVESLALGVPCLCSTAPAVVEASQGLAEALDPLDVLGWVVAIERLWLDDAARAEAASRIRREFRPRSWAEFGEDLMRISRELGGAATRPASERGRDQVGAHAEHLGDPPER
jgi:glycosyltransferase involved in cell wall biosynthesis